MQPGRTGRRSAGRAYAGPFGCVETVLEAAEATGPTDPGTGPTGGGGTEKARGGGAPGHGNTGLRSRLGATDDCRGRTGRGDVFVGGRVQFVGWCLSRIEHQRRA